MKQLLALLLVISAAELSAAEVTVEIDCSVRTGTIRALHGVNGGVLNRGETIDLTLRWRELGVPLARLHDCEWPSGEIVDLHVLFPSPSADPNSAASYRFSKTDDYVKAIAGTGARVVYRLGENIEHSPRKHHVHPPADFDRWAGACLGIIRHYNEGWADGFHYDIRYWEIWNEPENRPVMWTGTDEDYFRLYATTAKAIKAQWPQLKVGGPAVGATGEVIDGRLQPTVFLQGFARHCREQKLPLDFFSWHTYTDDPTLYIVKAKAIRRWLDEQGYEKAELHLNEWNYLPANDWGPVLSKNATERQAWYDRQGGPDGAAFIAAVLIELQDSPVDVGNFFSGDTGEFGLLNRYGVPKKTFYAMKAFRMLLDTPVRVKSVKNHLNRLAICAGLDEAQEQLTVVISNYGTDTERCNVHIKGLPWRGSTSWQRFSLDGEYDLQQTENGIMKAETGGISLTVGRSSVAVLKLRKGS